MQLVNVLVNALYLFFVSLVEPNSCFNSQKEYGAEGEQVDKDEAGHGSGSNGGTTGAGRGASVDPPGCGIDGCPMATCHGVQ